MSKYDVGFGLEERENPADFVLDVINDSQSVIGRFPYAYIHMQSL